MWTNKVIEDLNSIYNVCKPDGKRKDESKYFMGCSTQTRLGTLLCLYFIFVLLVKNVQQAIKQDKKKLNQFRFFMVELSHLELQLWGCGVLLSHMAWLHTPANMSNVPIACHLLLSDTHLQLTITPGAEALRSAATLSQLETPRLGGLPKTLPFPDHPAATIQMISHRVNHLYKRLWTQEVDKAWSWCN